MAKHSPQFPFTFRLLQAIIIIATVVVPLFFLPTGYPFAASKAFLIIALGCITGALLVTLWITDRSYVPTLPKITWVVGAYALWLLFTGIIGTNPNASFWSTFSEGNGLIMLFATLTLSLGLMTVLAKKDILKRLAWAFVCGGVGTVAMHYVGIAFTFRLLSSGGTIGNPSFAAAYLLFPLFAALYLICTSARVKKILPACAAIFIVTSPHFINIVGPHNGIVSLLGQSRAAAIALLISTVAGFLLYASYAEKKIIRVLAKAAWMLFFIAAAAGTYAFFVPQSSIQKAFIKAATSTRLLYGTIALEGIADRPIVGFGLNNYPAVHQRFFDPINLSNEYLSEGWVNRPHNQLLEIGTNAGLPGLALYLCFYGYLLVAASRNIRKGYMERKTGALFFGLFLSYFLQNIFLFETAAPQFIFWITVAWFLSYYPHERSENHLPLISKQKVRRAVQWTTAALAACGLYYFAIQPAHKAIAMQKIKHASVPERTENVAHIFAISPMGRAQDEVRFIETYAALYLEKLPNYNTNERSIVYAELSQYKDIIDQKKITESGDQFRLALTGAKIANNLALYSAQSDQRAIHIQDAFTYGTQALNASPRNQLAYLEIAKAYLLAGKPDRAITFLEFTVSLEPRYADAQRVLLRVIKSTGNETLYKEKLAEAEKAIISFIP